MIKQSVQYVWMGSYGIGPARAMAHCRTNADENGISGPRLHLSEVAVVIISMKDDEQVRIGMNYTMGWQAQGIEVVLDNRDERPGTNLKIWN